MPNLPPKLCAEPGCPNLVTGARIYRCPEHQRQYMARWEKPRDVNYSKGTWRKTAKIYLAQHPNCERCGAPAKLVHHIYRKREGGSDDSDNLEALCSQCHEAEHKHERWGRKK